MKLYDLTVNNFITNEVNSYYLVWNNVPDVNTIREVIARTEPKIGCCNPYQEIAVRTPEGYMAGTEEAIKYASVHFMRDIDEDGLAELVAKKEREILHF